MPRRKKLGPDPIDVHVGGRIRLRRTLLGMSQEKLSEALGITFQQVQKYESGSNRVGASRLFNISRALGVPVSFFYEGFNGGNASQALLMAAENDAADISRLFETRETIDLVRAYYAIDDTAVRRKVYEMLKSLGSLNHNE